MPGEQRSSQPPQRFLQARVTRINNSKATTEDVYQRVRFGFAAYEPRLSKSQRPLDRARFMSYRSSVLSQQIGLRRV